MVAVIVDGHELHVRVAEQPFGAGREVCQPGADRDDAVRFRSELVGGGGAGHPDAAEAVRVVGSARALTGLGFTERNVESLAELFHHFAGQGIAHTAADYDDRLFARGDHVRDILNLFIRSNRPCDPVNPLFEEIFRIIIRLAFHVLRKRDADCAGLRRIGENAHCIDQGRHQLFRTDNAVPVLHDRLESIIGRGREGTALLKLLKNRIGLS